MFNLAMFFDDVLDQNVWRGKLMEAIGTFEPTMAIFLFVTTMNLNEMVFEILRIITCK